MTFSDKLIALRKKAGWSQEELAERLNVSRQSVSKWESAQSMPDIDKILQLSSLFSVTTDCLLKDTQDDTDRLLEDGDFTRGHKAVKGWLTALTAAYWLVVVAIFLWYTFGPQRQRPAAVQLVHLGHCGRGLRRVCGCGKGVCAEKSVKATPHNSRLTA